MSGAIRVYQDDIFTMVDIKDGTMMDMPQELSIYRQRQALFWQQGHRKQLAIYVGRIEGLDFGASRFACGQDFAAMTNAKALVLENTLNHTYANMMLKMNKPDFPVYICNSVQHAREILSSKHSREHA